MAEYNNLFTLFCFIILLTENIAVNAQRVDTQPSSVVVLEGERTSLLCRSGKPINYCRIKIPGENVLVLSPAWSKPGFTYNGAGLDAGQCGVTIDAIKPINHGPMGCYLGSEGVELQATIDIIVALPPLRPELELLTRPRNGAFEVDQQLKANCISRDGRPAANITWFLDDQPITDGLSQYEIVDTQDGKNTTLTTITQTISRYLRADDDGKTLICRTSHFADRGVPQDAKIQLQVKFRPQPLPTVEIFGLVLEQTALINVTIKANPRPRTEWIVDGIAIPQGTQNGRYESYEPVDLGQGEFNVTLSIAGLTLEDTTKEFLLKASNNFGYHEYTVKISSSESAADNGIGMGSIIGIVVGCIVVVLIIALIIIARATGRWCFSDTFTIKRNTKKAGGSETSDTESAEIRPDYGLTKPLKLIDIRSFFAKKTNQTKLENDNEDNERGNTGKQLSGGDDYDENAPPSEATIVIEDAVPINTTEKTLVYAELMLKPSDDTNNPKRNSTEYAEIAYVNPGQSQIQQQKQIQQSTELKTKPGDA